jgi:hypothetical protein
MGSIGGGGGIGQQQIALAQVLDSRDLREDEIDVGDIIGEAGDILRDILEDDDEDDYDNGGEAAASIVEFLGCVNLLARNSAC